MKEQSDVSNQAVAVLLVLTILVTVVGTWLVLDALSPGEASPTAPAAAAWEPTETARVSLSIKPPAVNQATGKVSLTLVESPE